MKELRGHFSQLFLKVTEPIVFGRRGVTLTVVGLVTLFMLAMAARLKPDAGFEKQLPLQHPYIQVFKEYQAQFGGANLVLVAVEQKDGQEIYTPDFLETLRKVTDEVFFLPGIDRARVSSLFTPDVRFIEVVEGGFSGGNVIPADYTPNAEMLARIRSNVSKGTNLIGRLVANDQAGAMVFSELLEFDPLTGEKLDYVQAAKRLEDLRAKFTRPWAYEYKVTRDVGPFHAGDVVEHRYGDSETAPKAERLTAVYTDEIRKVTMVPVPKDALQVTAVKNDDYNANVNIHIIGFAKVVGDVAAATVEVVGFFGLTLFITLLLLWFYCGSLRIALLPLGCAVLAVIWELGMLHLFGFGLDPFAILVPFLVLSVGVSHGVQITNFWLYEMTDKGLDSFAASRATFRRLVIPGITALLTNIVGFGTILLIPIHIIQEMAWNACFGCVAIIVTKKILLPNLLSFAHVPDLKKFQEHQRRRDALFAPVWRGIAHITDRKVATVVLALAVAIYGWSEWMKRDLKIGELHRGVPELRPDSRFNQDANAIGSHFAIGIDQLKVIAAAQPQSCVDYATMDTIDRFAWRMRNLAPDVQKVISLPQAARIVTGGFNEGNPKWKVLPRNSSMLVQATNPFDTATGLLNSDCSAIPILIFTQDHKAETIDRVIAAIREFQKEAEGGPVEFKLASGNVGALAAQNAVIRDTERPMLFWVYGAIALCVWLSFRTVAAMACVLLPLALVSVLSYAVMVILQIGVKVSTLPVAAFAAGIGVDYGIYIYSVLEEYIAKGMPLR
ncbi:MAG TPA: hypothetical protein VM369_10935, partial [Candidatus Binatia bacterium]|nr:hypothetical protein [Candidatus Binatia bacterium]